MFGIKLSALGSLAIGVACIGATIDLPVGLISESVFLIGAVCTSFSVVRQFLMD